MNLYRWQERREAVKLLAVTLGEGNRSCSIMDAIEVLTVDAKWEVRSDVADLLSLLPEEHFVRAAAMLSEDMNAFVRRSAERAIDRRNCPPNTTRLRSGRVAICRDGKASRKGRGG